MDGQFTQIQTKVLQDKRLTPRDITVLLFLQARAGINGYCWWSYKNIGEQLGISRMTAIRAVKKLVDLNYIVKKDGFVEKEIEKDGKKHHEITQEQSANTYYINNNPDAGVVSCMIPVKRYKQYQECDSGVVSNLDSEINKGLKKNVRTHAHTRESEFDTTTEKLQSESGLLPDATPDTSKKSVNCPYLSEEIRRLREVRENFKNAFQKDIVTLGEFLKTSKFTSICFRFTRFGFDVNKNNDMKFSKFLDLNGFCVVRDKYFSDEKVFNYDE